MFCYQCWLIKIGVISMILQIYRTLKLIRKYSLNLYSKRKLTFSYVKFWWCNTFSYTSHFLMAFFV